MPQKLIGILGVHPALTLLAKACALHGYSVLWVDADKNALEKSITALKNSFDDGNNLSIQGLSAKDECLARIQLSLDMKALSEASFILASSDAPVNELVTTTPLAFIDSDIGTTSLAHSLSSPERALGFFPVIYENQIKLVEMIRAVKTSDNTLQLFGNFLKELKLDTIYVHDFTGSVFERVVYAGINEAIQVLYEGITSAESIDRVVSVGLSHPIGPLKLADLLGLDRVKKRLENLFTATANPKFLPSPLLTKLTEAGFTGVKAGRGFYQYKSSL
ncbi:hypothetical protein K1X76_03855 [bacterium]|nr:hypothetical protein [bacterium]